jgi:RNA polymerase sigma-70 factor (ECF subfamily)
MDEAPGRAAPDRVADRGLADRGLAARRVAELRAALASDAAFRRLYDEALPRVYGYLLARCAGGAAEAEDLTQTTFAEAIRRAGAYDGRAEVTTWLVGIARHKLVDHLRREARDERRRLRLTVRELELEDDGGRWRGLDDRASLRAGLARLPAAQRAVVILHYADGLPVREVARAIGRSESATESLLTRGRVALRAALAEAGDG